MIPQHLAQPELPVPGLGNAVDEASQRHPAHAAQGSREGDVREHGVDLVGGLVHLLEEEDRAAERRDVGRAGRVMHQGEIPPQDAPGYLGAASSDPKRRRELPDAVGRQRIREPGEPAADLPLPAEAQAVEVGPVQRAHAGAGLERQMEERRVGIPREDLRIPPHRAPVHVARDAHRAESPARHQHAADVGIAQHPIQVLRAARIRSRQMPAAVVEVPREARPVARRLEHLQSRDHVAAQHRPRGGDDADAVSGSQAGRPRHRGTIRVGPSPPGATRSRGTRLSIPTIRSSAARAAEPLPRFPLLRMENTTFSPPWVVR